MNLNVQRSCVFKYSSLEQCLKELAYSNLELCLRDCACSTGTIPELLLLELSLNYLTCAFEFYQWNSACSTVMLPAWLWILMLWNCNWAIWLVPLELYLLYRTCSARTLCTCLNVPVYLEPYLRDHACSTGTWLDPRSSSSSRWC